MPCGSRSRELGARRFYEFHSSSVLQSFVDRNLLLSMSVLVQQCVLGSKNSGTPPWVVSCPAPTALPCPHHRRARLSVAGPRENRYRNAWKHINCSTKTPLSPRERGGLGWHCPARAPSHQVLPGGPGCSVGDRPHSQGPMSPGGTQ